MKIYCTLLLPCMALKMLSHLQKAITAEISDSACLQEKKRTETTVKLKRLRYI